MRGGAQDIKEHPYFKVGGAWIVTNDYVSGQRWSGQLGSPLRVHGNYTERDLSMIFVLGL
jgi:hypothetical protein